MIVTDTVSTAVGIQQQHFTKESITLLLNFVIQIDECILLFHLISENYSNWK